PLYSLSTSPAAIFTLSLHDALPICEYASVFLSTAHPCKFPEAYSEELFKKIEAPSGVDSMGKKDKTTTTISVDFEKFKNYLLNIDRKSTRLNSSHVSISYAVFCLTE